MIDYSSLLSKIQLEAVTNFDGACLVIAGAGSGKTRVLTYRIAYMIENGVAPSSILSLTFTKKAATEMKERIATVVSPDRARRIPMGTFHSMFQRILRNEAEVLGFSTSFTIYQTSDSRNLVKTIIKEMNLDEKKYDPKVIYNAISKQKNNLVTPNIYLEKSALIGEDIKRGLGEFCNIYKNYMIRCKQNNAMDFDDLLLYTNILFRNNPAILAKYQDIYKYILVDEYQDTNSSQYLIIKKLAEKHGNLCVVGDDAQSIYSFRGARIENILKFQSDYPKSRIVKLEENYRSTQTIVNAANSIISNNVNQLKKRVFSKKEEGEKICLKRAYTDKEEALIIRRAVQERAKAGVEYKDIAILYRNNAQSKVIEDQLRAASIPYAIHKGHSFYEHTEIKNILAYVRLMSNSADDEALVRVINYPIRGIGATSFEKVRSFANSRKVSLWDAISLFLSEIEGLKSGAVKSINNFVALIEKYTKVSLEKDAYNTMLDLLQESGILSLYRDSKEPEKESAFQNVEELVNSLKQQCDSYLKENNEMLHLMEWGQEVILQTSEENSAEAQENKNKVTLMTIHSAKGLEYDTIFIVGVEEGMFPSQRSTESVSEIEEERRLFYVAVTRAISKLTISYALSRYKWGTPTNTIPSRFIAEIDDEHLDNPTLATAKGAYDNDEDEDSDTKSTSPQRGYSNSGGGYNNRAGSYNRNNSYGGSYGGQKERYNRTTTTSTPPAPKVAPNLSKVGVRREVGEVIESNSDYCVGNKVKHEKFGVGVIKSLETTATDTRICVAFEEVGDKNLLQKYAKLVVIE